MFHIIKGWIKRNLSDPQMVILVLLVILGVLAIVFLGEMLAPVMAAVIIAYLLEGPVSYMQKHRIPRLPAVIIVFTFFMACLLVLTIWLFPLLSRQSIQLLQQLPQMLAKGQQQLMVLPEKYPDYITETHIQQIFDFINSGLAASAKNVLSLSLASVRGLVSVIIYLLLVPLMVFFFLKDKEIINSWLFKFMPDNIDLATTVWHDVNVQITSYVRGKGWEILIIWLISYITFMALGIEYAMLLSVFTGLSVILPYIGVTVMFLPVALIAFFQWGLTSDMAYALIAYSVIQLFDGNLLAPLLLSGVVNLHPIAIIIAILVFGGLWGLWGLFFAIPLATLVNAIIKAWMKRLEAIKTENNNKNETGE